MKYSKTQNKTQNNESDIVLKIIHDNCDNKVQEFHHTNLNTVNQTNLDSLILVGKGHSSTNVSTNTQYNKKTQTANLKLSKSQPSLTSKETQTQQLQKRSSSTNSDFSNKSVQIKKNNVLPAFKIQNEIKTIQDPDTGYKRNIEEKKTSNVTTMTTYNSISSDKNKLTATNSTERSTSASSLSDYLANCNPCVE